MIGQYSNEEMNYMIEAQHCISNVLAYIEGRVSLLIESTINDYRREKDGSWTNHNCRTIS
jgi:hypothetical protein